MIDMARFLNRQPQVKQDENMDIGNKKKVGGLLRSAFGDIGNKISNNVMSSLHAKKEDGVPLFAEKKQPPEPFKREFILLPNQATATKPEPSEISKMDISEQDITDDIQDEHMKSTHIIDIDENDHDNPLFVADYVKDIYNYLMQLENTFRIECNFMENKKVTSKMRAVLVDWLIQVHSKFHFLPETLYLCVQILDTYLQAHDVVKEQLQLVGVTAMLLAAKYEEQYPPAIDDFVYMTDNTYSKADIRRMEIKIIHGINFMFGKPICLTFLRRFSKAGQADPKQHTLAKFIMELCLHDSEFSSFDPSYMAACSLCLSFKLLSGADWNDTLVHYSTYKYQTLLTGIQKICKLITKSLESDYKYKAAINKYSSSKFLRISHFGELRGDIVKSFASMN